jgi:hypothetical protein
MTRRSVSYFGGRDNLHNQTPSATRARIAVYLSSQQSRRRGELASFGDPLAKLGR